MKKILSASCIIVSLLLVSCGSKKPKLDDIIVTPETPIVNNSQSAKVCQPIIKYLECSLEKTTETEKVNYETAIKNLQREIENDDPALTAQKCASKIKILQDNASVVSKNGCLVESAYATGSIPPTGERPVPTPTGISKT